MLGSITATRAHLWAAPDLSDSALLKQTIPGLLLHALDTVESRVMIAA